ncbi:MAG TPA: HDOD domain-containing protein [Polyangiaceae bacterium]|jgi:putative nucleotidyltransferase with HDIG domain|nr:HDOD domain-containing protein [Polyangiaceae bacterium]
MQDSALADHMHRVTEELPRKVAEALARQIEDDTLDLPVLAGTAARVMQMALDEDVDPVHLADAIRNDGAMAGNLLRIANSPLYRARSAIVSLQQAISRLGMHQVREIALAIVCESRVFRVKGFEKELTEVFRHCLATAHFSQEIARVKRWNVEEAFLAGLMHDIGRPVLLQAVSDLSRELDCRLTKQQSLDLVTTAHERAGASLVTRWELPQRVSDAVYHHHHQMGQVQSGPLYAVVGLADELAHFALRDGTVDEPALRESPRLGVINLYPEEITALIACGEKVRLAVEAVG